VSARLGSDATCDPGSAEQQPERSVGAGKSAKAAEHGA
jgi:hypothetical protein